jgi:hypothetical protein
VGLPGSYPSPEVLRLSPASLPVDGGILTLSGTSFGPGPCPDPGLPSGVLLLVTLPPDLSVPLVFAPRTRAWAPASALVKVEVPCEVVEWSDTTITCRAPPALDATAGLRVVAGGQNASVADPVQYQAPAVSRVTPHGPVWTPGGSLVTVEGTGFPLPPWPVAVLVGDALCVVEQGSRAATSLDCVVPRGVGTVPVVVFSPLQQGNTTVQLTYAPPIISAIHTPGERPIAGGFVVEVLGQVGWESCDLISCEERVVLYAPPCAAWAAGGLLAHRHLRGVMHAPTAPPPPVFTELLSWRHHSDHRWIVLYWRGCV